MSAPQAAPVQVDVGEAFGYVFRSRNWFGKLAVGALCLLFFWLLFIPLFILLGYFVETARTISRGGRELPPWTNIGQKLSEGFVLAVVLIIWGLPGSILSGGGSLQCAGTSCSYHPGALAPLGGLYMLFMGLITAAIWSQYLAGGFGAAFDFRAIFRRATLYPGMTVIVWLIASVVGTIIGFLGLILLVIGVLFTFPYAFALSAHLYGQFAQRTEGAAGVAPAL
ncbi:MAG TPA: DUF4013 domain-containing protein [Ktedonobacterales bacterium]|nr:DUF4013 domain-containing protein [Ktedonobacterales bacterium]